MPYSKAPRSPSPLWALALSGAAVALVTYPVLASPMDTVLGGTFSFGHLWAWEMFVRGLLDHGSLVIASDALNYPDGGRMTLIGASHLVPLIALRAVGVPLILATNLLTLLHLVLGCFLAQRLIQRLTNAWPESMVGGLLFGLCPYTLSLVSNGQLPKLSVALVPLALLLLIKIADARRARSAVACGLTLALIMASSPYTGVFCAVLLTVGGVWLLAKAGRQTWRPLAARLALAAGSALLASVPFIAYYLTSGADHGQSSLLMPAGELQETFGDYAFSASATGWFNPFQGWIPREDPALWDVFHLNYLGWAGLLLAAPLLLPGRRWSTPAGSMGPGFFLLTALLFMVFAHGPALKLGGVTVPLPLGLLWDLVPPTKTLYVTYRAVGVVALALAVLAAGGLARLTAGRSTGVRVLACCAAAGLFLAETFFLSPSPAPVKSHRVVVPEVYRDLARAPGCGALLVLPYEAHDEALSFEPHRYYQIIHGKPLVHTVLGTPVRDMGRFHTELTQIILGQPPSEATEDQQTPRLHFQYVVLRERLIKPENLEMVRAFLNLALHEIKRYPADRIRLYETKRSGGLGLAPVFPRDTRLPRRCLDR